MELKKTTKPSYTFNEENLLHYIVDRGLIQLVPIIDTTGIIYAGLDDYNGDLNSSDIKKILESLAEKGALKIKETHYALFCPQCNSASVKTMLVCPQCGEHSINQIRLIEHSLCGYTGLLSDFRKDDNLVCPNCQSILNDKNIESKNVDLFDYKIIGSSYDCENCNTRFDRPNTSNICLNCGREFNFRTGFYAKYYEFTIPESTIHSVRRGFDIKVLLIEDTIDEATIIIKNLKDSSTKFTIDHVDTGDAAIEKIKVTHYDIILLDYILPGHDGLDILRYIREQENNTPVIMFTGQDNREIAVEAMKLGASDYIIKSVKSYTKLPDLLKKLINDNL